MKVWQLIHALTAEWVDLDSEVILYEIDNVGDPYTSVVAEVVPDEDRVLLVTRET